MYAPERDDRGSTIPLILGFFLIAMLVVAGAIAAGDAAMDQSDLQSRCDAAAVGIAASAVDTGRDGGTSVQFDPSAVHRTVAEHPARDPARADLQIRTSLSADALTVGPPAPSRSR